VGPPSGAFLIVIRLKSRSAAAAGAEYGVSAINCGEKMAPLAVCPGRARLLRYSRAVEAPSVTAPK
jgi:hypothetical protein